MYQFRFSVAMFAALALSPTFAAAQDLTQDIAPAVAAPKNRFPTSILARPFTMPQNSFETGLKLRAGLGSSANSFSLSNLEIKYGVTNDFEIGVDWSGLSFHQSTISHVVGLNLGYFLFANRYAASMVALRVPFNLDGQAVRSVSLVAPTSIPLIRQKLALMLFNDDLVRVNFDGKNPVSAEFALPFQIAWQAHSQWYFNVQTQLVRFKTTGDHVHVLGTTPVHAKALFAINPSLDIVAVAGFSDAQQWQDTFSVVLGVSFRGGALDG